VFDVLVIGGGLVGLSTAWQLQRQRPDRSVLLLEKESAFAAHQSGRNSGVVHAGIYYAPGSLKAKFCKAGVIATKAFCAEHELPFEQCGKLIVATTETEHFRLLALHEQARENGLDVELLDSDELVRREPAITGQSAIYLKTSAIVDYPAVARAMAADFGASGGIARLGSEVVAIVESADRVSVRLSTGESIDARKLIACGGLMADRLARLQGLHIDFRIIPFRGEYFRLPPEKNGIVRHLVYPVPDPALPFLGIHLTRSIDGSVTIGPNALQGWKREGYGAINLSLRDSVEMIAFPGFWRLIRRHGAAGLRELRHSLWKKSYLLQVQKYCPSIGLEDLLPHRTGVRAMAVRRDGKMIQDFLFLQTDRSLHVCSAPSPAATSAIPIGAYICQQLPDE